ncbi:MAG: histidine--tRNA ligase [Bacteroidetes bacterium]|nr:histidine--tRNA ligase [Bacteroidota bacterium]
MSSFKSISGTFDILPEGHTTGGDSIAPSRVWQYVEATIRKVMEAYGAEEIRTPILEPTELIARGIGQLTDIVSKEMFAFERGDTNYVLRPEVTAPVMRAYQQHHLDQKGGVQRLYYIGPCFRAERPQKGRYRQFHQFGLEIIGATDARADADTIACAVDVYRALGLTDFTIRLNSLGDSESRPRYKDALIAYITPFADQLSEISRNRLQTNPMRILDTKIEKERELLKNAPLLSDFIDEESRQHHEEVKGYLTSIGLKYVDDPFLVRGLDYYSRTAFEIESDSLGAQGSLAGGGRYDLLSLELGAKQVIPAVGFAAGMERLIMALDAANLADIPAPRLDAFIVALGDAALTWTFPVAQSLRAKGFKVGYDLKGRSLKAQMREASRQNSRYVIIVGDDELASGVAEVKDMDQSSQTSVPFAQLASHLTK